VVAKQCYTPLKRKKRMNNIHALTKQKKREKGEVCSAIHKTTMGLYPHLSLALDHEMSI